MGEELAIHADFDEGPYAGGYSFDIPSRTVRINGVVTDGPRNALGRTVYMDITPSKLAEIVAWVAGKEDDPRSRDFGGRHHA